MHCLFFDTASMDPAKEVVLGFSIYVKKKFWSGESGDFVEILDFCVLLGPKFLKISAARFDRRPGDYFFLLYYPFSSNLCLIIIQKHGKTSFCANSKLLFIEIGEKTAIFIMLFFVRWSGDCQGIFFLKISRNPVY